MRRPVSTASSIDPPPDAIGSQPSDDRAFIDYVGDEPSDQASDEPSDQASDEPSDQASDEPSDQASDEIYMFLERDQLVADTSIPVGRVVLGRRARVGLWVLRVFVAVVTAMVIYTFISQLH